MRCFSPTLRKDSPPCSCFSSPSSLELHLVGLSQSLVVLHLVFLVVGLSSIVSARLGFQVLDFGDLTSMLFFIARGWFYDLLISFRLLFSLCSLISLHLTSLLASLVALPFAIFATPDLNSVFLCVCRVSRLELWSLIFRALWFFPGMGALHVSSCFVVTLFFR
ncbi:hypothetical protein DY000_02012714 [Brassica cretica]|uniref:Transmembrane protein n=1 Tax=Brassica cretica TaxID=69181 RepID=A0ABQ7D7E4_BRACR|nr:hypothetical protein DY000_02012714 [Brassica cretica]